MPSKNSVLKYPNRELIFGKEFYNDFIEKTKSDLTYKQAKEIINKHTQNIAQAIENETDGFKLPKSLGYLCAIKYFSKKRMVDWKKTKEIGKTVFYHNLDTLGYMATVKMFKVGDSRKSTLWNVYMFKPCRKLITGVVNKFKEEQKNYEEFTRSDFLQKNRLENLYLKKYLKNI